MRTSTKVYIWACGLLHAAILIFLVWPSHHRLASDVDNIDRIVDLDLPEIGRYEYADNLDRGASCLDCFEYTIWFTEEVSEECIAEMEQRCTEDSYQWTKCSATGCYEYWDGGGFLEESYSVSCLIYKDRAYVSYIIREDEGICAVFAMFLYSLVLMVWGGILLICKLARNRKRKKQARNDHEEAI
jgi:hypothetical protein